MLNNNETTFADNKTLLDELTQLKELVSTGYFGENYMSNTYADTEKNMVSGKYAIQYTIRDYQDKLKRLIQM